MDEFDFLDADAFQTLGVIAALYLAAIAALVLFLDVPGGERLATPLRAGLAHAGDIARALLSRLQSLLRRD